MIWFCMTERARYRDINTQTETCKESARSRARVRRCTELRQADGVKGISMKFPWGRGIELRTDSIS